MAAGNFERCLAITLKWEGGYSNHPDDPGGPTMRGVIQREYDAWRKRQGKRPRPVRQIEDAELRAIYRENYWDTMNCDALPAGLDLCVFDAAVNSGPGRARQWLEQAHYIEAYCDARLAFLQRLGRLWRVFGTGWARRVAGIRIDARTMAGQPEAQLPFDETLHAGMRGREVRSLQARLRALGYPAGAVDGIFGEQTHRAVMLFQHDNALDGEAGVWQPTYGKALAEATPMLPRRREVSRRDLEAAGDKPLRQMNVLQRVFAWLFGAAAATETFSSDSVLDSIGGARAALEPLQGVIAWASTNRWLLLCAVLVAAIAMIRLIRSEHVKAYRNFDYQGTSAPTASND
ncbi:peptidoglycan-binding protein [Rhodomicrobium vannielii ATCC 17100]|uniref:glycosyl hydrolase 108 family protein n=1 Tax=Rhodomicrobium vannielii TaxID=1069 RepID=UPI001917C222|nr:glycosyl hydrolase 108 family protein [Rhodomicrobium vannielii]MBJ7533416.1 peptidoglycan-binding protein [Rhodomicrobium vannielii ATCC 17100]